MRWEAVLAATAFSEVLWYTAIREVRGTAVYLELVMVLNFLVDFLLLMGSARLCGRTADGKRIAVEQNLTTERFENTAKMY